MQRVRAQAEAVAYFGEKIVTAGRVNSARGKEMVEDAVKRVLRVREEGDGAAALALIVVDELAHD
eukprot:9035959-Lingulodinium_polyedra.AAC.1